MVASRAAVMGLDGGVTTARPVPFVPAYAERFCANCGFPFRDQNRTGRTAMSTPCQVTDAAAGGCGTLKIRTGLPVVRGHSA
jgi:hypothetical protein